MTRLGISRVQLWRLRTKYRLTISKVVEDHEEAA